MRVTFRHHLRSSRRFVFENIMDLEHVCVVHWRWFQNLRVRVRRPDYVEYRLTGLFYGLKQEVLARGGPLGPDHYWYEFNTVIVRMRVDGTLKGEDGNLTQTEVITFHFSPLIGPIMWLLKPLFINQKRDILSAMWHCSNESTYLIRRDFRDTNRERRAYLCMAAMDSSVGFLLTSCCDVPRHRLKLPRDTPVSRSTLVSKAAYAASSLICATRNQSSGLFPELTW